MAALFVAVCTLTRSGCQLGLTLVTTTPGISTYLQPVSLLWTFYYTLSEERDVGQTDHLDMMALMVSLADRQLSAHRPRAFACRLCSEGLIMESKTCHAPTLPPLQLHMYSAHTFPSKLHAFPSPHSTKESPSHELGSVFAAFFISSNLIL